VRGEGKKRKGLRANILATLETIDGSVSARQLFYQAVSAGVIENNKAECRRVLRLVVDMRRDGSIPYGRIVDRTRARHRRASWNGVRDVLSAAAAQFCLDYWLDQRIVPMVACEKQALEGIFREAVDGWGVPLYVIRGFNSESFEHEWAEDITEITSSGRYVAIYYFGDHDPSGLCIETSSRDKLRGFGADFEWERAGLVWEDLDAYGLVPIPVKRSDPRAKGYLNQFGDRGAELDALHPDSLRERIDEAVRQHIDLDRWNALQKTQQAERESLELVAGNWSAAVAGGAA
jgi:hypothetical protein